MKRFHVHVSVDDLDASIRFYSTVFGAAPTVVKPDYAKWMVDDPRINFAISKRGSATGIDHLGIQVESDEQLTALREQVTGAQIVAQDQANADVATLARISTGRPIRRGSRGRLSTPSMPFRFTATRTASRRAPAATPRRSSIPRLAKPARAARKGDLYETGNSSTFCFCAPAIRRAASWPSRS